MTNLDDRIRHLIQTISESAPEPPTLPAAPLPRRYRLRGPLAAGVAFAVVVAAFVGLGNLLTGDNSTDLTAVSEALGTQRHQILGYTVVDERSCLDQIPSTATWRLETWADFDGGRFRQQTTFPDGSVEDIILFGGLDQPTESHRRGTSGFRFAGCPEDLDSISGPTGPGSILFLNPPSGGTDVAALGEPVPGDHIDDLGRPAILYRKSDLGPQAIEFYVDKDTGAVLQTVTTSETEAGVTRGTTLLVSDENAELDPALFDTTGYKRAGGVDGTSRSIVLGTEAVWPEPLEPGTPQVVAERFAVEVLGWIDPIITVETDGTDPTWVTIDGGRETMIDLLMAPFDVGWGIVQIADPPPALQSRPDGEAMIPWIDVPGTHSTEIHAATTDGVQWSWESQPPPAADVIALPGVKVGDVATLLVVCRDASGIALTAAGGRFAIETLRPSPTTLPPSGPPSQNEADALRDGVLPEVAGLSSADRVGLLVQVESDEGVWVLSRPRGLYESLGTDTLGTCEGEENCTYGVDVISVVEYGEILLVDDTGEIVRAYPMPGMPPSWIYIDSDAVYAGRIGDGGLPDSTVARIDRTSLGLEGIVYPHPLEGPSEVVEAIEAGRWLRGWELAAETSSPAVMNGLLSVGSNDIGGIQVESWIGDVFIDLDAIRALFLQQS